jgi:rhodanese-related sulfurtransferase
MFGVDVNINMSTIDQFLNRPDVAYFDMRLLSDPCNFEEIGGIAKLTQTLPGFRIVPYPLIASLPPMPAANAYAGSKLFEIIWAPDGSIQGIEPKYVESFLILNDLFPKDKAIFLMCGGAGYAALTRALLVYLGWDPNLIYNTGANWGYTGPNSLDLVVQPQGVLATWRANYAYINLRGLTRMNISADQSKHSVSPETFYRTLMAIDSIDRQLIDIRSPYEFESHRLVGAINVDIRASGFQEKVAHFDRNKPVFIYCLRGVRTEPAIGILQDLGFKEVIELDGGIIAWIFADMPVISP